MMKSHHKAKKALLSILILILVISFTQSFTESDVAKATTITNTVTIYTSVTDGAVMQMPNETGNYWTSGWPASTGQVHSSDRYLIIGQSPSLISRVFLSFDCSSIPADAVVTSATLGLYLLDSNTEFDFAVVIQSGTAAVPHTPISPYDYYYGYFSGDYGNFITDSSIIGEYFNITLTDTSIVNVADYTKLVLRSAREIIPDTPTGDDYIAIASYENSLTYCAPMLTVTYETEGTGYIIHGPYYESGVCADANVSVSIYQPYNATLSYMLDGTDGTPDTIITSTTEPASFISWNITGSYNYTRIYYCDSSVASEEVWIYVPGPDDNIQQYSVNVICLAALTDAYVYTMENVNGFNRIIERRQLDVINSMPFWLCMYRQYSFVVTSEQNTWTWNLPADTIGTKTFTITADMVTEDVNVYNITRIATRINGTHISFTYYDPDDITTSITTQVMHKAVGLWVTDYTQTDIATNTQNLMMSNASESQSYMVNVTATRITGIVHYQLSVPKPNDEPVWAGVLDVFGIWPIPSYQLPAIFICLFIFAIGNWRDSEALAILALLVCGILQIIGWAYFPAPGIAFAFMIVVFMYIHRGKVEVQSIES